MDPEPPLGLPESWRDTQRQRMLSPPPLATVPMPLELIPGSPKRCTCHSHGNKVTTLEIRKIRQPRLPKVHCHVSLRRSGEPRGRSRGTGTVVRGGGNGARRRWVSLKLSDRSRGSPGLIYHEFSGPRPPERSANKKNTRFISNCDH